LNINFNKIYSDSNSLTIDFKVYEYQNGYFQSTNFSFGEIYYQTYHDIPEGHGFMSGKSFIILSNGTKIQTQDIKLNSDSTFEVFSIKHILDVNSPILEMTEYAVDHIEFEVYYFKSKGYDKPKILLSMTNEVGKFSPAAPHTELNELKKFLMDNYNLEYSGNKLNLPLSSRLADGDCDFNISTRYYGTTYHLGAQFEILAGSKVGYKSYAIDVEIRSDSTYIFYIYGTEPNYTDIERNNTLGGRLVIDFIFGTNDTISIPDIVLKTKGIIKIIETKQSDTVKLLKLMNENISAMNINFYEVTETLGNNEYKANLSKEYNSIINKKSLESLETLKKYFACILMKINKLKDTK
jgi:hypothetical protein